MLLRARNMIVGLACLCVALSVAGCSAEGDRKVTVRGTLTKGGQPLRVEGQDIGVGSVELIFYAIKDKGEQIPANVQGKMSEEEMGGGAPPGVFAEGGGGGPAEGYRYFGTTAEPDGTFVLEELPAGLYRVVVRQWDPYPEADKLRGAFGETRSPITVEVAEDQELNIELDSYK